MYISSPTLQRLRRVQKLLQHLRPDSPPQALLIPGSPEPRDNIIVFTGSFNPPTVAHLALLRQARRFAQQHKPMHLYAAFSKQTVDKERVERPLLLDRIMLLSTLLRRRLPHAGLLLFNRGLYVEQAQAIRSSFPRVKRIFFLMGFDKIVQILDPHYYEDRDASLEALFRQAELLVAPRGHEGGNELHALLQQPQNQRFARFIHLLPFDARYSAISSTHIRQAEHAHERDIPQEVRQFMRKTRAYAAPMRQADGSEVDCYTQRIHDLSNVLRMPVS